ncbi:ABC transporter substrate-binding protein [Streptomyces sp. NPDC020794]|uniref:ABC transporter substrate-binding protein n=1 Tax=unclassified Streptomyces TaxID=2593676 RepID=UPI0036EA4000
MPTFRRPAFRLPIAALAFTAVTSLVLAGCADPEPIANGERAETAASGSGSSAATDTWGLKPVDSVVALVPDEYKGKSITNAIYNDFPPEEFLQNGKLVGIQPDFAQAISEVMGVKFTNQSVGNFDSLIPGIVSGRYQTSTADFGVTKDRLKQIDFVTQFPIGTGFAVKEGTNIKINKATDLCGHSVSVVAGTYYIDQLKDANKDCAAAGLKDITLKTYPTDGARVLAVTNGRVEITGTNEDTMAYAIASQNVPLVLQKFVYEPVEQAIVLPKGSKLGPAVQAAMKEIVDNGTYVKILKKWGVEHVAYDSPDQVKLLTDPSQAS